MTYDAQQRPTASQALQYPFFQVNNAMPPLATDYEIPAPTFTRRPVVKSDSELRLEKIEAKKQAELKLEEGEVFHPPMISALREEDNPSLMHTTYVKKRIDQEPKVGRPSNIQIDEFNTPAVSDYITR